MKYLKYFILAILVILLPLFAVDIVGNGKPWFCEYVCPLGAIYSFFNPISLYRYKINKDKCVSCKKCQKVCKMDIRVYDKPNSLDCIRCGECKSACPFSAIETTIKKK